MNKKLFFPAVQLTLLALVLLAPACVSTSRTRPARDLEKAHGYFHGGNYLLAIDACDSIISTHAGACPQGDIVKAHQLRGECHKRLEKYTLARYDFESARRMAASISPSTPSLERIEVECAVAAGDTHMHEGAFRIADRIFASLLAGPPPAELADPLNFRRYICAVKLQRPDSEQFLRGIENQWNLDIVDLRKEFLDGKGGHVAVGRRPEPPRSYWSIGDVKIFPRSSWSAAPARANVTPMTTIRRITVHHTGTLFETMDFRSTSAKIKDYQEYHQETRGWADLGYHFVLDRAGRIWEGRALKYQGAHAGNSQLNRGNIGIALIGNYSEQRLYSLQKESLASLLALLCREYGLSPRQIATHRELKNTACPGKHLQGFVEELRAGALP